MLLVKLWCSSKLWRRWIQPPGCVVFRL